MSLFSLFNKSDILYFPDSITYYKYKEVFEIYKKIFSKLGISYRVIEKDYCSGIEALEAGYEQEARKIAKENYQWFRKEGIKSIITNSPESYKMFIINYQEFIPDWDVEIKNIWEIILEILLKNTRLIKYKANEIITFHDNCYLGRYCKIYEEPRKILEIIGYKLKEMDNNKEQSFCCGSCGGLPRIDQDLANRLAKERISQAKRIGMRKMIVCSMENYDLLTINSKNLGVEIIEFSAVLALALGLKKNFHIKENEMTQREAIVEDKLIEEIKINKI